MAYQPYAFTEVDWEVLLTSIQSRNCLPLLGAGASFPATPLGGQIARTWAKKYHYPMPDPDNLQRVAQYLALQRAPTTVKDELLREWFTQLPAPKPDPPAEPYTVLANLPIPL